jgi:hypothetical protein
VPGYGLIGALISAWLAASFIGAAELLMLMIRRSREAHESPLVAPAELAGHARQATQLFAADIAEGRVPGIRRIRSELRIGQPRAQQVRNYLAALASSQ